MKAVLFVWITISAVLNAQSAKLTPDQKEKAERYTYECLKDTAINVAVIEEAKRGALKNDSSLKNFIFCFLQKASVVTPDAKINIDVALNKLPSGVDKSLAEKVLNTCNNKKGKDAADTVFEITKCYLKEMKQKFFYDS